MEIWRHRAERPGGLCRQWRNTRTSLVFEALTRGRHFSPVLLFDDIDKAPRDDRIDPLRCLLGLLEPVTAEQFKDEFFPLPLGARGIVWMATANEAARIEPSLLSRVLVRTIEEPDARQRRQAAGQLFRHLLREPAVAHQPLRVRESAIERLAQTNPHQHRILVPRAVARALRDGWQIVCRPGMCWTRRKATMGAGWGSCEAGKGALPGSGFRPLGSRMGTLWEEGNGTRGRQGMNSHWKGN